MSKTPEEIKKEEEIKLADAKKKEVKWNPSYSYAGPQHIPKEIKNSSFTYGWIDYKSPGRLQAVQLAGWEIDKEILSKLGKDYNLTNIEHTTPIEGALIVGNSLLVRQPKERHAAMYAAEQDRVVEPVTSAKINLEAKFESFGEGTAKCVSGSIHSTV